MTRRQFGLLVSRRAAGLQPDMIASLLEAFDNLRRVLTDAQIQAVLDSGGVDAILARILDDATLNRAFIPVRARLRTTVERSFKFTTIDLPRGGKVNGVLGVAFDYLNPNVITAIRTLETSTLDTLKEETRAVVKQAAEATLKDGSGPKVLGRKIREAVGLAPIHEEYVRNYEAELRAGKSDALDRVLRDKRFDRTIAKAMSGEGLTEAQIQKMTDAYRDRWTAHNANTIAKTTTLQSYKAGQELTWKQARENGVVPPNAQLMKTWVTVGDERVRPEHVRMNGQTVPIDSPYSNGQQIPGESDFNCRCVSRITVEKAA